MNFTKADFLLMRWHIMAICTSLIVSALALYSTSEYAEKSLKDRRSAQNQLNDARNRLSTAYEDQKNMAIYADEYGALLDRKIIGENHRLDWMEGLEKIRKQNLVTDFRYSIAPQKIYTPQPAIDSGNFDINYSEMKLQFDLLHEAQLLDFFAALRKQIKGNTSSKAALWHAPPSVAKRTMAAPAAASAHLKAECSGGWITLKNRNAPQ